MDAVTPRVFPVIFDRRTGRLVKILGEVVGPETLFTLPPGGTIVWRYGDYRYLRSVIAENRIYFRRSDKFRDGLEGRFTAGNRERPSAMFAQAAGQLPMERIRAIQETNRAHVFLNCWHKNPVENHRMWTEYTTLPESIAIRTNVGNLLGAMPAHIRGADVHYVNETDSIPELHSLAALVHKRRDPYEFEQEFRLIFQLRLNEIGRLADNADDYRWIPVEPRRLLHIIRLHPAATPEFEALVRADLATAGLSVPVEKSAFSKSADPT
jgi:hypothetical protein